LNQRPPGYEPYVARGGEDLRLFGAKLFLLNGEKRRRISNLGTLGRIWQISDNRYKNGVTDQVSITPLYYLLF